MAYKYCTATNWGKNFFTAEERRHFYLRGHTGNVWVVGDNHHGDEWIGKVSGVSKTQAEAQAILDGEIAAAQAVWDALSPEEQTQKETFGQSRPVKYNLP